MSAWTQLTEDPEWCRGREAFPLPAYSEFLPPPWLSPKPYAVGIDQPNVPDDAFGWVVSEYEEEVELWPGLEFLARELLAEVMRLGKGELTRHITRIKLRNNPYWPTNLAARAGRLGHERYVLLAGVALSRTQDDKGRVRWTLFGSSEQGPGKAFWRGFFRSPTEEMPREEGFAFFAELLSRCYDVPESQAADPFAAGLRVLPTGRDAPCRYWDEGDLPSWASELLWKPRSSLRDVRYLLTFRPFALLPEAVQEAYLAGTLHLLPFPGSLVFWGIPGYQKLQKQLPLAQQMPLLSLFVRRADPDCLRVLQSGWLHEKGPHAHPEDRMRPTRPDFVRTHRWQKVHRHQDEVVLMPEADKVTRVLFSTEPDDLELYNKPMARNVQIWTRDHRLVLDGPHHKAGRIARAEKLLAKGGTFGYRFVYPAMRVGTREVYWHRPVCAFAGAAGANLGTNSVLLMHAPTGYLTAYDADEPNPAKPIELWPRFLDRPEFDAAIELFRHESHPHRWHTTGKVRSLLRWSDLLGGALPRDVARSLLALPERQTVEAWLAALPSKASDPVGGEALATRLRARIGPDESIPDALTFAQTATREFEESYWRTIAFLAHGKFRNKCSADCVHDDPTQTELESRHRELDALARHLVGEHAKTIEAAGVEGAWVGEHQFSWRTDFAYQWMGGWERNQHKRFQECNVIVRIPGRDSSQAVILADHYDTAYMHDRYYVAEGGTGARLAAAGADDNHSATAALLLAAPILLDLSRRGLLGCDVWLVHLTGEEFPADCLGARNLSQALVQGTLRVKDAASGYRDLSDVRIRGLYVADMIAHNNDKSKYVCQYAPGEGAAPARLAVIAHAVNLAWNALAAKLNKAAPRKGAKPSTRSDDPASIPPLAPHALIRGEIRPDWDPRSTLFNTDGQVFSDVGIPAVLFMEDYDINRKGYHDMYDTMANIDLDYGSALAAIFIETGARAASGVG